MSVAADDNRIGSRSPTRGFAIRARGDVRVCQSGLAALVNRATASSGTKSTRLLLRRGESF